MRTNFISDVLQRDPTGGLALGAIMQMLGGSGGQGGGGGGAAGMAQGVGLIQTVSGIISKIGAKGKMKKLMQQRKAFQTPEEVFDILRATQSMASSGYDPQTLAYLTGEIDRTFASSMGTTMRLGGDPNTAAALFDQKIQSVMKVGAENQALNMQNFSKYINALQLVAQNKEAEWASKENILKDKIQAAGVDLENANKSINSGVNTMIGSQAAFEQGNLYAMQGNATGGNGTGGGGYYRPASGGATVSATSSINPNITGVVDRNLTIPSWLLNPTMR